MNMKNLVGRSKLLLAVVLAASLFSCKSKENSGNNSTSLTGWTTKDKQNGGFSTHKNYKGQETPPGMVLIEGGTFTMGSVQDDVMFDWNTTPVQQQVRSFYMDEAEVTNAEYLFYLEWLEIVFPPSEENYKHIYKSALPDTLVWRHVLGFNELLTENYLRHPSYADYPVVGVSWIQANQYCKWRTDRVNEKILMDKGLLDDLYGGDSMKVQGKNHFVTETYLANPKMLFDGDSTIYKKGLPSNKKLKKRPAKGSFVGRHAKVSDGVLSTSFRLPTEAEWEYAAKSLVESREYNIVKERKKFAWGGKYTRNKNRRGHGDQLANFKQYKGDYSGRAEWSSDEADITQRVKFYPPNAFGLYDMSGNVAEWVADVYRPIIDGEASDFNYFRGNIFTKKEIDDEGKVVMVDYENMEYDTLDNGKIVAKDIPGALKYVPVTKDDAYMRNNYEKSYNVDVEDGDLASTKHYDKTEEDFKGEGKAMPRMYNHPIIPSEVDEEGQRSHVYDKEKRNTLISDQSRVIKGGSWKDREYWLDPGQRRFLPEYMADNYIGFRCATDRLGPMSKTSKTPYHQGTKGPNKK